MKLDYGGDNSALTTLFTQEMLKRGYLAASSIYVSFAHTEEVVTNYLAVVDDVFGILVEGIDKNNILQKLETRIKEEGFKRLN
jgi:glutamate-1-semialdehyde 2,1-aminomutase